ncbi:hypothetical protein AQUCO_01000338v1 [Aquilegia coerulea]|uniref:TF-B3 domain-containing protein n=1 Tax=Aquilegia coerulea TaxID=218851 RepID=A0A2G5E9G3_AQUCA|nr:hypothetical protein AQUCO_01000338v1 [Aquilegia coerulea]
MDSMLHHTSNIPNFFKVMVGDFQKKLSLPKALTLCFKPKVPKMFTLISPTGSSWMVSVKRVDKDFFLANGWKTFAEDYALELGEFVVFRYKGDNAFSVKVFGKNACEKEVPSTNKNIEEVANHVTSKYPMFTTTVPKGDLTWYTTLIIPKLFAKKYLKNNHLGLTRDVTLRVTTGGTWNLRYSVGVHRRLIGGWKTFVVGNNLKARDILVFELVDRNPIQMNCLPTDYIKNFNGDVPKQFILTSSTRRFWEVFVKKIDNNLFLSEQWPIFAKDNALEFGDLLVFIYNGNLEFRVKIFGSNACEKDVELALKNNVESDFYLREEKEGNDRGIPDKLHSPDILKCYKRRRTAEAAVTDKVTSLPNSMSIKTERSEVMEVGLSFNATFQPSRKYKIGIPNEIVKEKGLSVKDKMLLLDPCGRSWPVTIYCWSKGRTFLTAGWPAFCKANRLNTNDTCHFQFIDGVDNAIRVEIFRTRTPPPIAKQASAGVKMSTAIPREVIEAPTRKRPGEFVDDRVIHNGKQESLLMTDCSNNDEQTMSTAPNVAVLPSAFAKKHMKHAPRGVILRDSNGGTWHAQYKIGSHHKLNMGWKTFVFDNHLKECDVCIFELVDENLTHYELKVTIIRH